MIDPEAFEHSEEQFTGSVAPRIQEADTKAAKHRTRTRYAPLNSNGDSSQAGAADLPTYTKTGAPGGGSHGHGGEAAGQSGIDRTFTERQALENALDRQAEFWRQEVANRVEGYRARRSRKRLSGQFSMRLNFEAPRSATELLEAAPQEPGEMTEGALAADASPPFPLALSMGSTGSAVPALAEPLLPERSEVVEDAASATTGWFSEFPAPPTKIIEFPRTLVFPEFEADPNALAEPVFGKPRILDVPEAVGGGQSPLADIALPPADQEEEQQIPPEFELPLRVAPLPQRFTAGVIDALLVAVATGIFGTILAGSAVSLPLTKPMLALALAVPIFFWSVYHYLFLVHAAATPGMSLARVRMRTFQDEPAPRFQRRWRALVMVLSLLSLGFGFWWAFFDQDRLCWHDKMTRTYLAQRD